MVKSKKGWIKVVEAFLAIVMLIGVMTVIIQSERVGDERESLYQEKAMGILKGIQYNDSLREEVLTVANLPVNSTQESFPLPLLEYLNKSNLKTAECLLKVCVLEDECIFETEQEVEIYSREILISATNNLYSPRKLKVFCYK